jgi:hypothetical protein
MATTDARTGFRLPWSSDQRTTTEESAGAQTDGAPDGDAAVPQTTEGETMIEAVDAAVPDGTGTHAGAPAHVAAADSPASSRKPSKFLADLTKAMQAAAEAAREETVGRLAVEAKTHVEEIHQRSATEAADLRRRADDDVAAIREWSKTEIARIREETETRITDRKARLETEIEEHAALIERQIERVQGRVAAFEQEMAAFFERLLAEDDPTRFAAMAGSLPEPPPFDTDDVAAAAAAAMVAPPEPVEAPEAVVNDPWSFERPEPAAPEAEAVVEAQPEDPEAAMAAIQAAAEAAEAEEHVASSTGDAAAEPVAEATEGSDAPADDPRLSALGMSEDFAAAEAEAFAAADSTSGEEIEIPTIADDALAARLAGLVPPDGEAPASDHRTTQVVVTGLVSVASIAGFKRQLGRVAGVQSVGVSSGPDGEFVFAVTHGQEVDLHEAVPSLPGFGARVTGGSDDRIDVAAKDPESEA